MDRDLLTCNRFVDAYISPKPFPFRATLCNCLQSTGVPMEVINRDFIMRKKNASDVTDDPVQIQKLRDCVEVYVVD